MIITYRIQKTPLHEENVKLLAPCKACGGSEGKLIISHVKVSSILWMSSTVCTAEVICNNCSKKYPKSLYEHELRQIIKERKEKFKPSFLKKFGFFLFACILLLGLVIGFLVSISNSKKSSEKAKENYATSYDQANKIQWLENLRPGDIVLAKRNDAPYDAPATVFKLKSVEEQTVTFDAYYNETVPYVDYRDLSKIKNLAFGTSTSELWVANKKQFYKTQQLISAKTDDYLNAYSVLQVIKK